MKRHDFESSIKCSDSYAKLIYMHGEKLFIFDDGKYKIAAMQLAWEIYCDRCEEVEGLKKKQAKVEELQEEFAEDERFLKEQIKDKDLKISNLEYQQGMDKELIQKLQSKSEKLQKRVDAALEIFDNFEDEDDVRLMIYAAEQALKGEE